jgi:undecaprenyl-diphosphatase
MNWMHAIILSIVEGITEFLPISSTGHMILVSDLLKLSQSEFVKSFEILIQVGAILAVVVLYGKKLWMTREIWPKIFTAFLPTAIIGLGLHKFIKMYLLGNTTITLLSLFIGGIVLIIIEKIHHEKATHLNDIKDMSYKQAVLIGVFQTLAIIPGVSRSAATIVGAMLLGTKRKTAVEFSFLLAIPTMVAASGLDLVTGSWHYSNYELLLLLLGFVGAFITAIIAVKAFLEIVKKHTFIPFGIYRIVLAGLFWLLILR